MTALMCRIRLTTSSDAASSRIISMVLAHGWSWSSADALSSSEGGVTLCRLCFWLDVLLVVVERRMLIRRWKHCTWCKMRCNSTIEQSYNRTVCKWNTGNLRIFAPCSSGYCRIRQRFLGSFRWKQLSTDKRGSTIACKVSWSLSNKALVWGCELLHQPHHQGQNGILFLANAEYFRSIYSISWMSVDIVWLQSLQIPSPNNINQKELLPCKMTNRRVTCKTDCAFCKTIHSL